MIIPFTITDGVYTLMDAIVISDDVTLTDAEIEAEKRLRLELWVKELTTIRPENTDD